MVSERDWCNVADIAMLHLLMDGGAPGWTAIMLPSPEIYTVQHGGYL